MSYYLGAVRLYSQSCAELWSLGAMRIINGMKPHWTRSTTNNNSTCIDASAAGRRVIQVIMQVRYDLPR